MTTPVPGDFWSKVKEHARSEVDRFARSGFLRNSGLTGPGNKLTASGGASLVQHDAPGNVLFQLDAGGEGLEYPRFDLGQPMPTAYALWPSTASTTLTSIAERVVLPHHARLLWNGSIVGDAGTQGTVQLYVNGNALGPAHICPVGGQLDFQDVVTLPSGFYDQLWNLQLKGQVASGTGSIRVATWALLGLGST